MLRILMIDNYDSFTYNLVQYLGELGAELEVVRNDAITLEQVADRSPDRIVISPGPGIPSGAGVTIPVIQSFAGSIPVLGVCLGHQAIGEAFGGTVIRAPELMHGKTSMIHHRGEGIFHDLECPFQATRYHSLIVEKDTLPEVLSVTAWTSDGMIMGLQHRELAVFGVQFHPESIMTKEGKRLLENFLCLESTSHG